MTVPILPGVLTTPTVLPDGYDATADPTHLGCAGAPANRSLSASRGEVAGGQSGNHDAGRTPRWAADASHTVDNFEFSVELTLRRHRCARLPAPKREAK